MARKSDQPTRKLPQSTLGVPTAARRATSRQLLLRAASTKSGGGDGSGVLGGHVDVDRAHRGGYAQSTQRLDPKRLFSTAAPREKDSGNAPTGPRGTAQRINALRERTPTAGQIVSRIKPTVAGAENFGVDANAYYYTQMLQHGQISPGQAVNVTALSPSDQFDLATAELALHVNQALGGIPERLNAIAQDTYNNLTGNNQPKPSVSTSTFLNTAASRNRRRQQANAGGTKGSTGIVDRSEAVKRAWATRKKMYGSSGKKAS